LHNERPIDAFNFGVNTERSGVLDCQHDVGAVEASWTECSPGLGRCKGALFDDCYRPAGVR
jgi:hypothetical protein